MDQINLQLQELEHIEIKDTDADDVIKTAKKADKKIPKSPLVEKE